MTRYVRYKSKRLTPSGLLSAHGKPSVLILPGGNECRQYAGHTGTSRATAARREKDVAPCESERAAARAQRWHDRRQPPRHALNPSAIHDGRGPDFGPGIWPPKCVEKCEAQRLGFKLFEPFWGGRKWARFWAHFPAPRRRPFRDL